MSDRNLVAVEIADNRRGHALHMPTAVKLEAMLAAAQLAPLAWRRGWDLALPPIRAAVAACS